MSQQITISTNSYTINETSGEQGTIIAVHGLTGNYKQLHQFQEAFKGEYRFITYDIRGRGNSDPTDADTSIFTHANDLIDLIKKLEIKRPILMGYSMGAYICALVASKLPEVEALILLDGAGKADDTSRELVIPSLDRLKKVYPTKENYIETVKNMYTNLKINWTEELSKIVEYDIKQTTEGWEHKSIASVMEQDFESFYEFNPEKVGNKVSCPTFLLIARGKIGKKAPLFQEAGYQEIQKEIALIKVHYTDVNHYELVFNKQPKIVNEIKHFLNEKGVN